MSATIGSPSTVTSSAQPWDEERRRLRSQVAAQGRKIEEVSGQVKHLEAENAVLTLLLKSHDISIPTPPATQPPEQPNPPDDVLPSNDKSAHSQETAAASSKADIAAKPVQEALPAAAKPVQEALPAAPQPASDLPISPVAGTGSDSTAAGEDEADLAPKDAASAIIDAFRDASKGPSGTLRTGSTNSIGSTSSSTSSSTRSIDNIDTTSSRTSVSSAASEPSADSARINLKLKYNNSSEKLSLTLIEALDLSKLGVVDFSKLVFKADLIPGRLVTSKSPSVVYSHGLPLDVTLTLAVRQTSFKWKKLQLSILSAEGAGESYLGRAQINLLDFYNTQSAEPTEMWIPFSVEGDDTVFSIGTPRRSQGSTSSLGESPAKSTAQERSTSRGFRRHTLAGEEMASGISKHKEQVLSTTTPTNSSQSPRRTSLSHAASVFSANQPERQQQRQRMGAAVMQAARGESQRKPSSQSPSDTDTLSPAQTPPASRATAMRNASLSQTSTTSSQAKEAAATALAGVDIPDVRSLNRSRTGDTAVPKSPQKDAKAPSVFDVAAAATEKAVKTTPVATAEKRPSLSSLGKATSVESLSADKRRNSSTSEELKRAMAQNRAAKEVLAALDKEDANSEAADKGSEAAEDEEEVSQFVRRASFRLNELRSSQRKKPDRLSFRQKQAFFGTANVNVDTATSDPKK